MLLLNVNICFTVLGLGRLFAFSLKTIVIHGIIMLLGAKSFDLQNYHNWRIHLLFLLRRPSVFFCYQRLLLRSNPWRPSISISGLSLLIAYTLIKFYVFKPTKLPEPEKENVRISPIYSPADGETDSSPEDDKKERWFPGIWSKLPA